MPRGVRSSVLYAPAKLCVYLRQARPIVGLSDVEDLARGGRPRSGFCRCASNFSAGGIGVSSGKKRDLHVHFRGFNPVQPAYKTLSAMSVSSSSLLSPPQRAAPLPLPQNLDYDVARTNPSRHLSARSQPVGDDSASQGSTRGPVQDKGRELLWSRSRHLLGLCGRSKVLIFR